jgi:TolB protein
MANADGSDESSLVNKGMSDSAPAWSPDGKQLAFTADQTDQQNVYTLDIASGEATKLTEDGWDFQPVWSMDNSQILFTRDVDDALEKGTIPLFIMKADGSDLHEFKADEKFKGDPTYSPDGSQVVYMSNEDGNWHIYLMDADGSNVRRLTEGTSNNMFPAWRPVPAEETAGS